MNEKGSEKEKKRGNEKKKEHEIERKSRAVLRASKYKSVAVEL